MNPDTNQPNVVPAPTAPQQLQSPGPSASVLQQKRPITGTAAHKMTNVKSRRLAGENGEVQTHAPHLMLADNSPFKVEIRRPSRTVGGPRETRHTRPLPPVPTRQTPNHAPAHPLRIARRPSFQVNRQPAQPHACRQAPAGLKQQPSFEVLPQPADQAVELELWHREWERLEQERVELELIEQEHRDQDLVEQELIEQERVERERVEWERVEWERDAQLQYQEQRLEQEQATKKRFDEQCLEKRWAAQYRFEQRRLEQQRTEQRWSQREGEQRLEAQQQAQRLEAQRLEDQRLESQRLEDQRFEAQRLKAQRLEAQRLKEHDDHDWMEQRQLQQEQQVRDYQVQLQELSSRAEQEQAMELDSESTPRARSATLPVLPAQTEHPVVDQESFTTSPLPFQDGMNDDPLTYQSPAKPAGNAPYRVPSPTFQCPAPATGDSVVAGHATAQLVSLLLQQGEQTNRLIETLVRENREFRAALTTELQSVRSQLKTIQEAGISSVDDKEEGETDDEDVDLADDKGPAVGRQARKQQKKLSVFKDPELRPALKYLQSCVRQHLFFLFDVKTMEELVKKNPPITQEEMQGFLDGDQDSVVCSMQHFRIDFQRPWKENIFNKLAKDVFVKSFLALQKSGEYNDIVIPPELLMTKAVGGILDSHMEYRRKTYRDHLSPLSAEDKKKLLKRKAMNSRRFTLQESRVSVIVDWGLNQHKRLVGSKLRPIHMSGDETDDTVKMHPPTFRIIGAKWQSLALKTFLRTLDTLYRSDWANPVGSRATSGNPPRCRVERVDGRSEDGVAPIGLWRNCYDQAWLQSLRPHVRQSLNIIDSDYNFSLLKVDLEAQSDA